MSVEDSITKKIGPLPAWAWAGSVVLLILLFRHWQQSQADAADTTPDPQTDLTDPANDPTTGDPFAGGGFTGTTGTGADPTGTETADALGSVLDSVTNQGDTLTDISSTLDDISNELDQQSAPSPKTANKAQWGSAASDYLIGSGVPPTKADNAIYRYLHHQPLTEDQRRLVNQALKKKGHPPGGVISILKAPVPHPKPVGKHKDTHHSKPKHKVPPKKKAAPKKKAKKKAKR